MVFSIRLAALSAVVRLAAVSALALLPRVSLLLLSSFFRTEGVLPTEEPLAAPNCVKVNAIDLEGSDWDRDPRLTPSAFRLASLVASVIAV